MGDIVIVLNKIYERLDLLFTIFIVLLVSTFVVLVVSLVIPYFVKSFEK